MCRLIRDNEVNIYLQDFNIDPLEYWGRNEALDRKGINENLHVQGYLRYWDDLLTRNPSLWIDSCVSGGRRNDLETLRRSVPLHYSDCGYGNPLVKLSFHRTMYEWMPYFKEDTRAWDINKPAKGLERLDDPTDAFAYHCGMAPMLFPYLDIRRDDHGYARTKSMMDIWRRESDILLYGDFYPLTPFHRSAEQWVAWQFDRPETSSGLIQGIRLPAAREETFAVYLKGLHAGSMYFLENPETGDALDISGADLIRNGFTFAHPKRIGAIWFYRSS